jgi:hypothetical protein
METPETPMLIGTSEAGLSTDRGSEGSVQKAVLLIKKSFFNEANTTVFLHTAISAIQHVLSSFAVIYLSFIYYNYYYNSLLYNIYCLLFIYLFYIRYILFITYSYLRTHPTRFLRFWDKFGLSVKSLIYLTNTISRAPPIIEELRLSGLLFGRSALNFFIIISVLKFLWIH